MQSTTPHPTKAKTQAGGVGAPWTLYVTLIIDAARTRFLQLVAPLPRQAATGVHALIGSHTFRATSITAYLANGGALEHAQQMAAGQKSRPSAQILIARLASSVVEGL
jgi:hypothetical protein